MSKSSRAKAKPRRTKRHAKPPQGVSVRPSSSLVLLAALRASPRTESCDIEEVDLGEAFHDANSEARLSGVGVGGATLPQGGRDGSRDGSGGDDDRSFGVGRGRADLAEGPSQADAEVGPISDLTEALEVIVGDLCRGEDGRYVNCGSGSELGTREVNAAISAVSDPVFRDTFDAAKGSLTDEERDRAVADALIASHRSERGATLHAALAALAEPDRLARAMLDRGFVADRYDSYSPGGPEETIVFRHEGTGVLFQVPVPKPNIQAWAMATPDRELVGDLYFDKNDPNAPIPVRYGLAAAGATAEGQSVVGYDFDSILRDAERVSEWHELSMGTLREVVYRPGSNPDDGLYASVLSIPGFRTAGTAASTEGVVTLYGSVMSRGGKTGADGVMLHEIGHLVTLGRDELGSQPFGTGAGFYPVPGWAYTPREFYERMFQDADAEKFGLKGLSTDRERYGSIVSSYGSTNSAEDMAEMFRLGTTSVGSGKTALDVTFGRIPDAGGKVPGHLWMRGLLLNDVSRRTLVDLDALSKRGALDPLKLERSWGPPEVLSYEEIRDHVTSRRAVVAKQRAEFAAKYGVKNEQTVAEAIVSQIIGDLCRDEGGRYVSCSDPSTEAISTAEVAIRTAVDEKRYDLVPLPALSRFGVSDSFRFRIDPKQTLGVEKIVDDDGHVAFYDSNRATYDPDPSKPLFQRVKALPGYSKTAAEAGAADEPGALWRGMRFEEYQDALKRGSFASIGDYNLSDAERGLTYFSTRHDESAGYAAGFTPWQFTPTFDRPGVLVKFKGLADRAEKPPRGAGSTERVVKGEIPFSHATEIFFAWPYYMESGHVEMFRDRRDPDGKYRYREGSRSSPDVWYGWHRGVAGTPEIKEAFEVITGELCRADNGQFVSCGLGSDALASPEFKAWFGDSKVVDDVGNPLRVYHGTTYDFDAFNGGRYGLTWFAAEPQYVNSYANHDIRGNRVSGGRVIPLYVSMKNPLVFPDSTEGRSAAADLQDLDPAKRDGYDGVLFVRRDGSIRYGYVYDPANLKSALVNKGTFDPRNDRLREAFEVIAGELCRADNGQFVNCGIGADRPSTEVAKAEVQTVADEAAKFALEVSKKRSDILAAAQSDIERIHVDVIAKYAVLADRALAKGDSVAKHSELVTNPDGSIGRRWTPERAALHEEIIKRAFEGVVSREHPTFILTGGLPGSGKTTAVAKDLKLEGKLVVNSDDVKVMLPEYAGFNAAYLHEEATEVAETMLALGRRIRADVVLDGTMKTYEGVKAKIDAFKAAGYRIECRFVDVDVPTSVARMTERLVRGDAKDGKGRYVPVEVIRANALPGGGTKSRATFERLRDSFDAYVIADNRGAEPVEIERKGRLTESAGWAKWLTENAS